MDALALARLLRQIPEANQDQYDFGGYANKYGMMYKSPQDMALSHMATGQHGSDEFKLPEHITFSTGSQYSAPDIQGGQWQSGGTDRWQFTPSVQNLNNATPEQLADYFKNRERQNTFVKFPNGSYVEGSQ